jgi:hypothetical protein
MPTSPSLAPAIEEAPPKDMDIVGKLLSNMTISKNSSSEAAQTQAPARRGSHNTLKDAVSDAGSADSTVVVIPDAVADRTKASGRMNDQSGSTAAHSIGAGNDAARSHASADASAAPKRSSLSAIAQDDSDAKATGAAPGKHSKGDRSIFEVRAVKLN